MVDDIDVAALVDRRLAENERIKQMPPPPPPMSETNRLLADAYAARQAQLHGEEQDRIARRKAAEETENLRRFEEWLAAEPMREEARESLAIAEAILASLNRRAAPLERQRALIRKRIQGLREVAES